MLIFIYKIGGWIMDNLTDEERKKEILKFAISIILLIILIIIGIILL